MASKGIVAARRHAAVTKMKAHAEAIAGALGIDASGFLQPVKADADFQEMTRSEQTADLLAAIRAKVAPEPELEQPAEPEPAGAPSGDGAEPAQAAPAGGDDEGTDAEPEDLNALTVAELKERAKAAGVTGYSAMHKADLVAALGG